MKKNAIAILVHQMPEQVNMFLSQLLVGTSMDIYLHVDKKVDSEEFRNRIIKDERIKFSKENTTCRWSDVGILKGILLATKDAVESGIDYNYVLCGTGQDLLIRNGLDDFLDQYGKKVFVHGYEDNRTRRAFIMHKWPDFYRQLIDFKLHPVKILRRARIEFFKLFPIWEKKTKVDVSNLVFYYYDMWTALPLEVARYVVEFWQNNPDFMKMYDDALVPEETYMLTVIMNSKYKDWVEYEDNGESQDLYYLKGFGNGHPYVVTMDDIPILEASGKFFSRKFDIRKDREVVEYFCNKIKDGK